MLKESFPFSHRVNASDVVDSERKVTVKPEAASLDAIARTYDLVSVSSLVADLVLKPYRKAGLRVAGRISMELEQTCVVSLETFKSSLVIDVDRTFEPVSARPRKARDINDEGEIEIDLETLDPPDVIVDGTVDLGALICEELALELDPFPRKPGVEFETADESADEAEGADVVDSDKPSPFAVLQTLKIAKTDSE